jgi:hypothetical protein
MLIVQTALGLQVIVLRLDGIDIVFVNPCVPIR